MASFSPRGVWLVVIPIFLCATAITARCGLDVLDVNIARFMQVSENARETIERLPDISVIQPLPQISFAGYALSGRAATRRFARSIRAIRKANSTSLITPISHFIPRFRPTVAIRYQCMAHLAKVSTSKSHNPKENNVNVLKHMEAVFVVTVAILGAGAFVTENLPEANARPYSAPTASTAAQAPMTVVYVTAKRLTPEQKRLSLEQERRSADGSRT